MWNLLSINLNLTMKVQQTKLLVTKKKKKGEIFTSVRHGRSARDRSNPQMEHLRSAGTDSYMWPSCLILTSLVITGSLSVREASKVFDLKARWFGLSVLPNWKRPRKTNENRLSTVAEAIRRLFYSFSTLGEGEGAFSSQNITIEQQSLGTAMMSSSSSLSSSSSYSSSSSASLLWSSSSLLTTKKKINTTPVQLSKTSKTLTVNLSNGFTTPKTSVNNSELAMGVATEQQNLATGLASSLSPSITFSLPSSSLSSSLTRTAIITEAGKLFTTAIYKKFQTQSSSENTYAWLSVNTMTSSIVDSIESSSPSLAFKSSKGSNLMGKYQNEAIEKVHYC